MSAIRPVRTSPPVSPDPSWREAVLTRIAAAEYDPTAGSTGIQAPNRAQDFRTHFHLGAVELVPRRSVGDWQLAWRTTRFGRADAAPVGGSASLELNGAPSPPVLDGRRVVYARGGLREWYENTPDGLEQGFTIVHRPAGTGPLAIEGRLDGLSAALRADGTIELCDGRGTSRLEYGGLAVWDAAGMDVESWLAVGEAGDRISILIADEVGTRFPVTVDPIFTAPAWSFEANQLFAHLGESVATAGDVNRDGFSDVLVGAPMYDNGQDLEGRVFGFHGSALGLATNPSWIAESEVANARFGNAVAAAGDVNGDGFGDVVIGAFALTNGQTSEGRAYVYHGSAAGLSTTASWTAESNQAGAFFGFSVGTAGDVNGDGFADVVVGVPQFDNGELDEGQARVYHGSSAGLATSTAWTVESNSTDAELGSAVGTAGDVNGDGFADVVVGAEDFTNGQTSEGRALVYHGASGGLSTVPAWTVESNVGSALFGRAAGTAGDVNGDGYADVVVGAPLLTNGQGAEGRVYLYQGSATGLGIAPSWTQESNASGAQYGTSVATAGDVNADGYADIVVGAPKFTNDQTREGRSYVYQGSAGGLELLPASTVESNRAESELGSSVGTAGDVNGDGYSDVVAGANLYDNGQGDEGAAFVYLGMGVGPAVFAWSAESNQAGAVLGPTAGAGDVNGDGFSDVLVGAPGYDNGEDGEGKAFAYHGSASGLSTVPNWSFEPNRVNAAFGFKLDTAGDVNGDGYSDVIITAQNYPLSPAAGIPGTGQTYVFHGSATGLALDPAWTAEPGQPEAQFGYACGTAGDVNGDGFGDVVIGASFYDNEELQEGRAYLYEGSPAGLQLRPAWTVEGNQADAGLGDGVATAGDVNGDGYSDLLIGASFYSNGQQYEGIVYLFEGSPTGPAPTPSWAVESDLAGAILGRSIATAGDVNGDGYSDALIGSPFFSDPEEWEGKVFLYEGSAAGLETTPAWFQESNQANAFLGRQLETAGDVNGDGYSDVLVTAFGLDAPRSPEAAIDEGIASIYPGSPAGLSTIPIMTLAGANGQHFGSHAGLAGDVNGDGFSDVLVGTEWYENGQSLEGGVFLYYGNRGDGLDRVPRQSRTDNAAPIDLLGLSNSTSSFRVKVLGRTPAGRGRVRMEVEVKPTGVVFDGTGLLSGALTLTGVPGAAGSSVPLALDPTGLALGSPYHWRLRLRSNSPFFPGSRWFSLPMNAPNETDLRTRAVIAVEEPAAAPAAVALIAAVAPNPFHATTEIAYVLPRTGRYELAVYDAAGRKVVELGRGNEDAGRRVRSWDGRDGAGRRLPAGVYFLKLGFEDRVDSRKVILTR